MRTMLGKFIGLNRKACRSWFDCVFPESMRIDGNRDFVSGFARAFVKPGMTVYDVGGGKNPLFDLSQKTVLGLRYVGVDIDADELARAAPGVYDEVVAADIAAYRGRGDGDVVICQALLEHVQDIEGAFSGLTSILRRGGRLVLFVPSRNAVFARLNMLLPQGIKRAILFSIFPSTARSQGFPSYYNQCTPRGFMRLANANGLSVEEVRLYWISMYFSFFVPLFLAWRLTQLFLRLVLREQAAETFSMVLVRR